MKPYLIDVEQGAIDNEAFRRVMYTTPLLQVQFISMQPSEELGTRANDCDHFYLVVQGGGDAVVDGECSALRSGWCLLGPAGVPCNIINTGQIALKLLMLSAPPAHRNGASYRTRRDADLDDRPFGV